MKKIVTCQSCDGSGVVRCPKCKGTGYTGHTDPEKCKVCGRGDGAIPCGVCNGKGMVEKEE
jgi:DnaJ-class molecular chaperone